jgi:hypothetical protein
MTKSQVSKELVYMARSLSLGTLAAVLLIGSSAIASAESTSSTAGSEPSATTTNLASKDEIVCKKIAVTGQLLPSRFGKVCHTRGEWEDIQRQSQEQVEHAQQLSGAHPG